MSDEPSEPEIVHLEVNLRRVIKPSGQRAWRYQSTIGSDCDEQLSLLMCGVFHVFEAMRAKERKRDDE
jgi:hypothetical protein